ncbi:MAG: hypothetical protein KF775_17850 [Cyclobacteriaceae bacterium]|nr:hypothetical protein [Cyclobacteriaceae bacterium]
MKRHYLVFIAICISSALYAQELAHKNDSTTKQEVIHYTPYYSQPVATAGTYVKSVADSNLFKFGPGIDVYNFLRGRVPNLVISPYVMLGPPGFRTEYYGMQAATVLVDGVPFNGAIGEYLNMSAWEYSSITASPSALALSFLDVPNKGIISLASRSGAGYKKLGVEFNSTPLAGVREFKTTNPGGGTSSITYQDWYWRNSIALLKDFGATDMRVSFSTMAPWMKPDEVGMKKPMSHFLNLNLGHKLGSQGEVRLLANTTLRPQSEKFNNPPTQWFPANEGYVDSKLLFLNLNLSGHYKFTDWLKVTAQTILTTQDSSYESQSTLIANRSTQKNDSQKRANLYLNFTKNIKGFAWSGFAGVQYQVLRTHRARTYLQNSGEFSHTFERTYASGGTSVTYKDLATLSAFIKAPLNGADSVNYSFSGTFNVASVVKVDWLTTAKVRAATGKNYFTNISSYPYQLFTDWQPLRAAIPVTSYEWGVDAGFFQNKLEIQITRFHEVLGYSPGSEIVIKGIEGALGYRLVGSGNSTLKTQLASAWMNEGNDFRGSVLIDYMYNNLFVSAMAERIALSSVFTNQRFTRLRDVTVGLSIRPEWLAQAGMQSIDVSLSARNIFDFGGESLNDFEVINFDFIKSYMGSLTIRF